MQGAGDGRVVAVLGFQVRRTLHFPRETPHTIAVRKGQPALVNDLDAAVRALKADGTLAQIQERWRPQEMLFASRQRVQRVVNLAAVGFLTVVCAGLALWLKTATTQVRARQAVESALVKSQQRLRHSLSNGEIDTIERKHAEGQVRLLAHALRSANDCVSITDTSHQILYLNEAFLRTYEYEEQELIGRHISIVRSDNDPAVVDGIMLGTLDQGWRGTVWNLSKTGRVFPVSLATSLVYDDRGAVVAAVGVARDITKEMATEEALRRTEIEVPGGGRERERRHLHRRWRRLLPVDEPRRPADHRLCPGDRARRPLEPAVAPITPTSRGGSSNACSTANPCPRSSWTSSTRKGAG